ncbi:DUF6482 family protein [Pseudomonas borbori]
MTPFQLRLALLFRRPARVEVLSLRSSGYRARVIHMDESSSEFVAGHARLWLSLEGLKSRLRRCGVRQVLLLQPQAYDEIISRPMIEEPDPGLWLPL